MLRRFLLIALAAISLTGASAWGALSGSYLNGAGMTALNALAGNPFVWSVDKVGNNWVYTYSFTPSGSNRGVAFIDLEVGGHPPSDDFSYTFAYTTRDPAGGAGLTGTVPVCSLLDQTLDLRPNPNVISSDPLEPADLQQFQSFSGSKTPGFDLSVASVITGIQWSLPSWPYTNDLGLSWYGMAARQAGMYRGFNSGWTLTLTTSSPPMWGRFYLDGGDWTSNNGWLFARSSQYDNPLRPPFDGSANFSAQQQQPGWIPVPDFPPAISSTSPSAGATSVAPGSPVSVTFSEDIDEGTLNGSTFTVTDVTGVDGTIGYDKTTRTATFTPAGGWSPGTTYTVSVLVGVKDLTGNPLASPRNWSFTTAGSADAVIYSGFISDISTDNDGRVGYVSNAWSPDTPDFARGIRLGWDIEKIGDLWRYRYTMFGNIKATDKAVTNIDIGTPSGFSAADLLPGWTVERPDSGDISADVTVAPSAAILTEASDPTFQKSIYGIRWHFDRDYIVKDQQATMFVLTFTTPRAPVWGDILISSDVAAGAGYSLAWNSQFGQSTSAPVAGGNNGGWVLVPGNAPGQSSAPGVVATTPADGATGVNPGSTLAATFSADLDPATVNENTFLVNGLSGQVSYDAVRRVATFTPSTALSYGTLYTATVTGGIKTPGGVAMGADKSWSFSTPAPPDTTPPTVTSATPAGGSVSVDVKTVLNVVFSEPLDPASVDVTTFTLRDGGGKAIDGSVVYVAATNTAIFTPGSPLSYYTTYTASLAGGIKDPAGNALAPKSWSFTTQALSGDLDGSGGTPTLNDALLALRITVGLVEPTSAQLAAFDVAPLVDGKPHPDGKINGGDVIVILRRVVGLDQW